MPTLNRRSTKQDHKTLNRHKANRDVYNSHRWHEYSRQYRKKHRLCVECLRENKTTISECVDHIIPIEQGGDIWNPSNHQALCNHHHSIKTREEQKEEK